MTNKEYIQICIKSFSAEEAAKRIDKYIKDTNELAYLRAKNEMYQEMYKETIENHFGEQ